MSARSGTEKRRRDHQVCVRLTGVELADVQRAAREHGTSPGEVLREALAENARLRAAVEAVLSEPDDTQWWPVEPYMDPPDDDEVAEVHVVNVDRIRAALTTPTAVETQP